MRRFFSFWWLCARTAFWGNAAFANDWQWVFGNPIVSSLAGVVLAAVGAVAPTIAKRLGATEMTTGTPVLDSFLGALAAFVLTWLVAYIVRLLNAPVVLFHDQKDRADKLDGTPLAKKSTPIDKQIAILKERYLAAKPAIQASLYQFSRRFFLDLQARDDRHLSALQREASAPIFVRVRFSVQQSC